MPYLSKSKSNIYVELKSYKSSDVFKVAREEYFAKIFH